MPRRFRAGNPGVRKRVYDAVQKENKAISGRPSGWSAGEARRSHRRGNAQAVRALRRG